MQLSNIDIFKHSQSYEMFADQKLIHKIEILLFLFRFTRFYNKNREFTIYVHLNFPAESEDFEDIDQESTPLKSKKPPQYLSHSRRPHSAYRAHSASSAVSNFNSAAAGGGNNNPRSRSVCSREISEHHLTLSVPEGNF